MQRRGDNKKTKEREEDEEGCREERGFSLVSKQNKPDCTNWSDSSPSAELAVLGMDETQPSVMWLCEGKLLEPLVFCQDTRPDADNADCGTSKYHFPPVLI